MNEKLAQLAQEHKTNAYLQSVGDVVDKINLVLPWGYQAVAGWSTHEYDLENIPENCKPHGANVAEYALCGFVRVHAGDPHFPVFIYRETTPMPWGIKKVAHILNVSERRVRALATARNAGTRHSFGWLFTEADVEAMKPDAKYRRK